jgi:hypothetical protein
MRPEILDQTRKLIKEMNMLMVHLGIYMLVNLLLLVFVFNNITERWGLLFIVLIWALGVIYHGIRVYGRDPMKKKGIHALMGFSGI